MPNGRGNFQSTLYKRYFDRITACARKLSRIAKTLGVKTRLGRFFVTVIDIDEFIVTECRGHGGLSNKWYTLTSNPIEILRVLNDRYGA